MFGALVLGGGLLVATTDSNADPDTDSEKKTEKQPEKKEVPAQQQESNTKSKEAIQHPKDNPRENTTQGSLSEPLTEPQARPSVTNCQMEFTLYKYDRESIEPVHTCLDEKTNEEILKIIEESKKQTCMSPFCGCWLG